MSKEKAIKYIKGALTESDEWWYEGGGGKHSYKKIQRLLELSLKELED